MPDFLSDEWFRRARELAPSEATVPGLGFRIQFDADGERWYQVAVDGVLTEWARGDVAGPDLEIHLPLDVAHRYYTGEADGTETLEACRVLGPDGTLGVAPPLDLAERPELAELPYQPDATLLTQYRHRAGPFGPFDWWWQFVDGRSEVMAFGEVEDPDVTVKVHFERLIGVRTGQISIYEAIEGGRVDAEVGPLMLLAGMYESPEQHAAELACGPAGRVLAALGELQHQAAHQEALAALRSETT